jgi:hypothetical protein
MDSELHHVAGGMVVVEVCVHPELWIVDSAKILLESQSHYVLNYQAVISLVELEYQEAELESTRW